MEKVRLGDLLLYEQPTKYLVESDMYDDSYEVPVLTAGKSFLLGYTDEKENIFENVPVIIFDDFTTSTQFVDFPFKVKSSAMKILNCNNEKADIRYMFYLLQTIKIDSERHKRYWISQFAKMDILLPSLSVQQAIAAQLDQARELVQYHHQLLEKYDELQQSLFLEMFGDPVLNEKGWEKKKGNDIFEVFGGGTFKSKDYSESGIPLIRIGTVNKGFFDESELVFLPNDFLKSHSRFLLKSGDLLMTLTGTVGKDDYGNTYILDNKYEHYFLNQRVAKIEVNPEYLNKLFLTYVFRQPRIKGELTNINRGVRQANISNRDLHSLNIILPPLSLQNEFASYIESIEYQKSLVKEALQQSEDVFNGLLQESFG